MWYQDGYIIAVTMSGSDTDKTNTYTEKQRRLEFECVKKHLIKFFEAFSEII